MGVPQSCVVYYLPNCVMFWGCVDFIVAVWVLIILFVIKEKYLSFVQITRHRLANHLANLRVDHSAIFNNHLHPFILTSDFNIILAKWYHTVLFYLLLFDHKLYSLSQFALYFWVSVGKFAAKEYMAKFVTSNSPSSCFGFIIVGRLGFVQATSSYS